MAAVVEDRVSAEVGSGSFSSFNMTVDCGTASDRFIWFGVANEGGGFGLASSVTYNSVNLTNLGSLDGGGFSWWALGDTTTEPATGSNTLTCNYSPGGSNSQGICAVAIALSNVDLGAAEVDAVRSSSTSESFGSSYSAVVTTVAGDYCLGWAADWKDGAHAPTGDSVERFELDAVPTNQKQNAHFVDFEADDASATIGANQFSGEISVVNVIKGKAAAGLSIPVAMHGYRQRHQSVV